MSEGLSSTSFCRIATALRYSASASAGLPVLDSRMPRLKWLSARPLRNSVSAGLSSTSFCRIASALRYSASALRRLARPRQEDAEVEVDFRQAAAEFGVGGVVVDQLLPDRQRLAELGLRLRRLARVRSAPSRGPGGCPPGRCGIR